MKSHNNWIVVYQLCQTKLLEIGRATLQRFLMIKHSPFRYFKTSPEVIRLAVMLYVRFPLSLRNVEDLLHERGVDVSHETGTVRQNRLRRAGRLCNHAK